MTPSSKPASPIRRRTRIRASYARSAPLAAILAAASVAGISGQSPPQLDEVLARVSERIQEYYGRAQSIVCTEKVTAQPINRSMSPEGFARTLEYELRVEAEAAEGSKPTEAVVVRELKKVNGRAAKPTDENGRNSCFDPSPLSSEPLAFLLPGNRDGYTFSFGGAGKGKDRHALVIDYVRMATGKPEIVAREGSPPECFQIALPVAYKGRVWVDAKTFHVLRVEQRLSGMTDFAVPLAKQRKHHLPDNIVIERYDTTIRYQIVAFEEPVETMLLPESIDVVAIVRNLQSHRKHQTFSGYKRFLTGARIVK